MTYEEKLDLLERALEWLSGRMDELEARLRRHAALASMTRADKQKPVRHHSRYIN